MDALQRRFNPLEGASKAAFHTLKHIVWFPIYQMHRGGVKFSEQRDLIILSDFPKKERTLLQLGTDLSLTVTHTVDAAPAMMHPSPVL